MTPFHLVLLDKLHLDNSAPDVETVRRRLREAAREAEHRYAEITNAEDWARAASFGAPERTRSWDRAAAYARIAIPHPHNIERQLGIVRRWVRAHGREPVVSAKDNGWNANDLSRPGLGTIMAAAARGEIDALVITGADRLARSYQLLGHLSQTLEVLGVAIWSISATSRLDIRQRAQP
jgi:hypothetical protein